MYKSKFDIITQAFMVVYLLYKCNKTSRFNVV